jgi:hypothetical protein
MIPSHKQKASKTPRVRRAANCGSTSRASWARGRITIRAPLVAVWPPWGQPTLPDLRCVRRRPRARTGTWTPHRSLPFPARRGTAPSSCHSSPPSVRAAPLVAVPVSGSYLQPHRRRAPAAGACVTSNGQHSRTAAPAAWPVLVTT